MEASRAIDPAKARRGFSIVELMVAIAVLSVLVIMLAVVFQQVSRTWTQGEQSIERRRSARALTDYIGVELQAAMLPAEGVGAPGKSNLQFVINPPETQVPGECRYADAIFWQAPLATESTYGEIAEIGYFVRWVAPGDTAGRPRAITGPRPALCRFFVNPSRPVNDPSQPDVRVAPNPDFLIYSGGSPNAWLSPTLLDRVAGARAPTYAGLFGENVVGLWVRSYGLGTDPNDKTKAQELPRTFYSQPLSANDPQVGYVHTRTYLDATGKVATKQERYYLPARVQISIAQIDSHHAARLDVCRRKVQQLTRDAGIRDAESFLTRLRSDARGDATLAALLPGLRSYSTEVALQNAR